MRAILGQKRGRVAWIEIGQLIGGMGPAKSKFASSLGELPPQGRAFSIQHESTHNICIWSVQLIL